MSDQHRPMFLPALRATMGDWVYYITVMTMDDIASRVSVVDDIHSSKSLKEWLQRQITSNSVRITEYLISQEQRLFNAIVVGTYGGRPNWHEIAVSERGAVSVPENIDGTVGLLEFCGDEALFAIDGQHRVVGIKEAVKKKSALREEGVCTIFVKGVVASKREDDPPGFQRTRRLFSTLNRYAKPVQKRDIIALDEDDVVAIVTRRLLEEHPLLLDKVDMGLSKSIRPTDRRNLTTIVTLYDVVDMVLCDRRRGWKNYKTRRPAEAEVDRLFAKARSFWDALCSSFDSLRELRDSSPEENIAGQYRDRGGGNLLYRPVGLMLIGRVVVDLLGSTGMSLSDAVRIVGRTPVNLSRAPWLGLLWDGTNERMLTTKENQKVARQLLFHALGGDLTGEPFKTSSASLKGELSGILNQDVNDLILPRFIEDLRDDAEAEQ